MRIRKTAFVFALLFITACSHRGKDDLLASLLGGTMPFSHTIWSHAGPGNQGPALENTMVSTIGLARTTLECGFQDVNLSSVISAIAQAKGRGVAVRIGMDEDNRAQPGFLQLSQFLSSTGENRELLVGNAGAGQVYTTICTADGTRVFAATASPTIQGFYNQPAFGWYFQDSDQELPRKFQSETDLLGHGSFGSSKQVLNRKNFYLLSDMEVGVYMAPKEGGFESFMVPRVRQARTSIQIFSSEFFSNDLDSSDVRRTKDLAYEILNSSVPKQVVVTSYAAAASDPDAFGGLNSANYLANNGIPYKTLAGSWPRNGLNIAVVDGATADAQLFVSSFPFSARADSSHDGFLLVFQYRPMIQAFSDFYNQLQARAVTNSATGDNIGTANGMEVVISELNWMGGYDSAGSGTTTEYVELYNNTSNVMNISNWRVECGSGGAFATLVATIPTSTLIGPGQYFLLAQSSSSLVAEMHSAALSGSGLINDSTTEQCRLTDGVANGGTVVDVIGVNGTALSSNANSFGVNNTTSLVRRSMERTDLSASGANTTNWHTNSNTSIYQNINFVADKIYKTYGTPGYFNSAAVPVAPPPSASGLVINEVIFNDSGTAANDMVEIYNPTGSDIDLAAASVYFHRDSGCSISGGGAHTSSIALTGTITAGGYFRLAEATGSFAGTANQTATFNIATGDCLILTNSSASVNSASASTVLDFVAIGRGAADKENSSYAPGGPSGSISRCANGADTNVNGTDFLYRASAGYTPGAANFCSSDPRGLKINEVAWNCTNSTTCGGATGSGDMIEIYNPTGSNIDLGLAGVLYRRDSSCTINGGGAHTEDLTLTGTINAGGYYVIAGAGGIFAPGNFAASTSLTTNHCVLLTQGAEAANAANNAHVIDFVDWDPSVPADKEGGVFAPGGTTSPNWIKRCANGTDTNVNSSDFVAGGGNISAGSANNCP